ncbi:MAG: hypothetical protein WC558_16390 [Patulibacter sp.]
MLTHHPRRRPARRRLQQLAFLTIATAASATAFTAAANAEPYGEVTGTSITSPAPNAVVDADYGQLNFGSEVPPTLPTLHVTGKATTAGAGPHSVRVGAVIPLALFRTALPLWIADAVPVAADGSFAADVPVPPINARIIALPENLESSGPLEDSILDGVGPYQSVPVLGGAAISSELPGIGNLSLSIRGQQRGFAVIAPAGFASFAGAPFAFGALGGVTTGAYGDVSGDVGLSFMGTGGISDQYNDARGGVTVDGTRGYLRDHIPVGSDELAPSTSQRTVDQQTGGQTIVQTQPVYVAVDPSEDPNAIPLEGGYRPSGLELQRTSVQDHDGRQVSVTDRFRSTDGKAHKIDVFYAEGLNILPYNGRSPLSEGGGICLPMLPCGGEGPFAGPLSASGPFSALSSLSGLAGGGNVSPLAEPEIPAIPAFEMPAFRIPWETGDKWESRSHAEPLTAPAAATSTVYTRLPSAARLLAAGLFSDPEGEFTPPAVTSTYGAITFGTRPDSGLFVSDPYTIGMLLGGTSTQFVARFVRDVPAGGDTTIPQVYSTGTTPAEVEALAAAAERRLTPVEAPKPAPPVAPPAPPTPPAARKAPSKLTTSSSLKKAKGGQYRFRFSGRLTLPSGVAKSACRAGGGTVMVQVKAGSNTISTRRVKLDRNCKYSVRINFRSAKRFGNRTRLTVLVKWSGNRALAAKPAKKFTVKVR